MIVVGSHQCRHEAQRSAFILKSVLLSHLLQLLCDQLLFASHKTIFLLRLRREVTKTVASPSASGPRRASRPPMQTLRFWTPSAKKTRSSTIACTLRGKEPGRSTMNCPMRKTLAQRKRTTPHLCFLKPALPPPMGALSLSGCCPSRASLQRSSWTRRTRRIQACAPATAPLTPPSRRRWTTPPKREKLRNPA